MIDTSSPIVMNNLTLWRQRLAGVLVGVIIGAGIGSSIAEPVTISRFIVEVGKYLCHENDGLKTIYRHGRSSNVYSWHCKNQAEFNEIPVIEEKIKAGKVMDRTVEDWR